MPTVFVIHGGGHSFKSAEDFGKLVIMSEGLISKFHITKMFREFEQFLKDSSEDDYLLQSGPTVMNMIASAIFAAKHGCLNLLVWRVEGHGRERYVSRRLIFRKESYNVPKVT